MTGSWIIAGIVSIGLLVATIMWFSSSTGWMVLAGLLVVIWAALGLTLMVRKYSIHYELTTQRFIHMEGLLKRVADRIEVIDIDDVTYQQGLVERMVGVGNIKISSSDRSHPELWMRGIENVKDIANMIDEVRRKERRRRGVHIEAI